MGISFFQAVGLVFIVFSAVFWKPILRPLDRLDSTWSHAVLKSIGIFLFIVLAIVMIPAWVLQSDSVAKTDRIVQDLIGSGVWLAGLGLALGGLVVAHRSSRI